MTVTGGLAWWKDFVVVACYNFIDQQEQVRRRHHSSYIPLFISIVYLVSLVPTFASFLSLLTPVEALSTLV